MSEYIIDVTDKCSYSPNHGDILDTVGEGQNVVISYTGSGVSASLNQPINVYSRSEFNKPYKISDKFIDCSNLFNTCINFDQPITIPERVVNCSFMLYNCYSFNKKVTIPKTVENAAFMMGVNYSAPYRNFRNIVEFKMPTAIKDLHGFFSDQYNYNESFTIPQGAENVALMFQGCHNYSRDIRIPNSVKNASEMFAYGCNNYNSNITFDSGFEDGLDISGLLRIAYNYNKPFQFPDSDNCIADRIFDSTKFNCEITIPNTVCNMYSMFNNCLFFDNSVTIEDLGTYDGSSHWFYKKRERKTSYLFNQCANFNGVVTGDFMGSYTFNNCRLFNKPVNLGSLNYNIISREDGYVPSVFCSGMFMNCKRFNSPVTYLSNNYDIPFDLIATNMFRNSIFDLDIETFSKYLINCQNMFRDCSWFNKSINNIGAMSKGSVLNCDNMFRACWVSNMNYSFNIPTYAYFNNAFFFRYQSINGINQATTLNIIINNSDHESIVYVDNMFKTREATSAGTINIFCKSFDIFDNLMNIRGSDNSTDFVTDAANHVKYNSLYSIYVYNNL